MFYVPQISPAPPGKAVEKEEQHIAARMWGWWMDLTRINASQFTVSGGPNPLH
jgi:hypothetical protein